MQKHDLIIVFGIALLLGITTIHTGRALAEQTIQWQTLNEPGSGGWMTSVRISPHDSDHMVIGGDMLGIGTSRDGGDTWSPGFGLSMWEIGDVTFHPDEPQTVWAGTMAGPYVSYDGGDNWESRRSGMPGYSGGSYSVPIEEVLFDPNNHRRLIAIGGSSRPWGRNAKWPATRWGVVWESIDEGETWQELSIVTAGLNPNAKTPEEGVNIAGAQFAAGSSDRIYAVAKGVGFVVSEDGGTTWEQRIDGLPHSNTERLIAHPTDPDTAWVALAPGPKGDNGKHLPGGVHKTTDAGRSWSDISNGLFQHTDKNHRFTARYKALAVSPTNPDRMAVCEISWNRGGIFLTTDGGKQWHYVAGNSNVGHKDHPDLAKASRITVAYPGGSGVTSLNFDPNNEMRLIGAGGASALESLDGGKTWSDTTSHRPDPKGQPNAWRGNGYSGLCAAEFVFHPTDPNRSMFIALDAGKMWESRDGMKSWVRWGQKPWPWGGGHDGAYSGDYGYVNTGQHGQWYGILRTADGGNKWTVAIDEKAGLPKRMNKGASEGGVYAHPEDGSKVWAVVKHDLYHSTDAGKTWNKLTVPDQLMHMTGDDTTPGRFYVTGKKGIWRFEPGAAPKNIGGPHPAGRGRIETGADGRVYVCQWRSGRSGLWRYDGKNWSRLLDESHAYDITIDPTDPTRMALITNDDPFHDVSSASGVWVSNDDGASWVQANDGLDMTRGTCIVFNPHDPEQLVAGTWGGGYYIGNWSTDRKATGKRRYNSTPKDRLHATFSDVKAQVQTVGSFRLTNGSMDAGTDTPAGWKKGWNPKGTIEVSRDTTQFKTSPASLRVDATGSSVKGQAEQNIGGKAGESIQISGFARSTGEAKINIAVQSFNQKWKPIAFEQLRYIQGDSDWLAFSGKVTLPEGAARNNLVVLLDGQGTVWVDDLKIEPAP